MNDLIKHQPELLLKIESLIQREWQGPLDLFSPQTLSLSTLFTLDKKTPESVVLLKRDYWFDKMATPLQFSFFRRSPLLKYIEQFLVIATLATMLTYVGIILVEAYRVVETKYNFLPVP